MEEEKKTTSEAQKRATQKYLSQFIDMKIRVTPKGHEVITAHAKAHGESTAAFIRRAIFETMERDNELEQGVNNLSANSAPQYAPDNSNTSHEAEANSIGNFFRKRFNR